VLRRSRLVGGHGHGGEATGMPSAGYRDKGDTATRLAWCPNLLTCPPSASSGSTAR
jgi:hypothetical protein